jgi:Clostridium P-47 protein
MASFEYPVVVNLPRHLVSPTIALVHGNVKPMADPAPVISADTFGWDTVFAIRVSDVNRAIVKQSCSPHTFSAETCGCTMAGDFGDWKICLRGDGHLVRFAIPIAKGHFTMNGKTTDISGATAEVELRLEFLPHAPEANAQPGDSRKLVVKTSPNVAGEAAVTVEALDLPKGHMEQVAQWTLQGMLEEWLNAHIADFGHIFSEVVLNAKVDKGSFDWLDAKYTSYAYLDGPTDDTSMLGVLCLTRTSKPDQHVSQLSHAVIPQGARAGFLISETLLMERMILPALPHAFPGSTSSDFELTDKGTAARAKGKLAAPPVPHDGKTYYPVVEEFTVSIVGNELHVASLVSVELSAGIYGHMRSTHFVRLTLANKADGSQTISYEEARPPAIEQPTVTYSEGVGVVGWVLVLFGVLVTLILSILTGGAFLIVAMAIVGLIIGAAVAAPNIVGLVLKKNMQSDVPSIDLLVLNSTAPIRWAGAGKFRLTGLQLNGCLQFGGDPAFAS